GPVTVQYRPVPEPAAGQTGEGVSLDGIEARFPAPAPIPPPEPEPPPAGIVATESVEYVAAVKTALEAHGVSLAGPDGAFEITANVAYGLRLVGYGLLEKTSGNMSQGYPPE